VVGLLLLKVLFKRLLFGVIFFVHRFLLLLLLRVIKIRRKKASTRIFEGLTRDDYSLRRRFDERAEKSPQEKKIQKKEKKEKISLLRGPSSLYFKNASGSTAPYKNHKRFAQEESDDDF
jgi:hypothetical protein